MRKNMKRTNKKLIVGVVVLILVISLFAVVTHTKEPTEKSEVMNVVVEGIYIARKTIELDSKITSVNITSTNGLKVSAIPNGTKLVIETAPEDASKGITYGSAVIVVTTKDGRRVEVHLTSTIYSPKFYVDVEPNGNMIKLIGEKPNVKLRIMVTPPEVSLELKNVNVSGRGVAGFKVNENEVEVVLDAKQLPYVGQEELTITADIVVSVSSLRATFTRTFSTKFNFVNLFISGVIDGNPISVVGTPVVYFDKEANKYVYMVEVISSSPKDLVLSANGDFCISSYPLYYGEYPECWKAIEYSIIQKAVGLLGSPVSSSSCSLGGGCAIEICEKEYLVAPLVKNVLYIASDKKLNTIEITVKTLDGVPVQKLNITGFKETNVFPTVAVDRVWNIVSSYMPVILATGTDGAPIAQNYLSSVTSLIYSPVPNKVRYSVKLFAIVPNNLTEKEVKFRVLAPSLGQTVEVVGKIEGGMGSDYTVYGAIVELSGTAFGLLPIDIILFIGNKPYLVEHTYLTVANMGKGGAHLPSVAYGNTTRVIDYNALEIVKFWGYAVVLLKSNETVLTKGGYIMKNDASITLRLDLVKDDVNGNTFIPDVEPYRLFNITEALKIMFFGDPSRLDAVGVYGKVGDVKEDGEVPVVPIAYTIQPKYAFADELSEHPERYVKIYNTIIDGKPRAVVSNPTPYQVRVVSNGFDKDVEPFSIGIFDSVEKVVVLDKYVEIAVPQDVIPLKLEPTNYTLARRDMFKPPVELPFTIVEIPIATSGKAIDNVSVFVTLANGKTYTVEIVPPGEAMLSIKSLLSTEGQQSAEDTIKAYFTIFNNKIVLNIVVPKQYIGETLDVKISLNGKDYDISFAGDSLEAIKTLGTFDVAPLPNFYAYYLTSYRPVYFIPVEHNPYKE